MDSRERIIRQRLSAEYKQAEKELRKELDDYYKRFQKQDKEKAKLVSQGKLDRSEYIKWRKNKMLYKETLNQKVDVMSQHLLNVNKQARDIIRKEMFGVYADQYNFGKYEVEKGLKVNTSFTLFDQKTVERMADKNPKLLPERKAPDGKILKYSRRKVNTAITQGVLKGDSIDKIAQRLSRVVGMEERYALTNARTAMTGAQNAGRLDSYFDSKKLGINVRKQWMATLDERTRESHQMLDGESRPIEEPFSNGLMYPANADLPKSIKVDGHKVSPTPAEVYNCRCTMIADLPDFPPQNMMRLDNVNGTPIEYATYNEWAGWKKGVAKESSRVESITRDSVRREIRNNTEAYNKILQQADANNVEYVEVEPLSRKLSEDEIIERIAGGDMTSGSCVSLAMAYAGNVGGYDVLDFRGGMSMETFAKNITNRQMARLDGVVSMENTNFSSLKGASELITQMEDDKMYMLITGKHASIVRKVNGKAEYLELQSEKDGENGWKPFQKDTLKRRFGCTRSKTVYGIKLEQYSYAIDVESLSKSSEFQKLLGYINTAKDKQKKGVSGSVK